MLQLLPVIFVMSIVVFSITKLLPGDPTLTILGEQASPEQREVARKEYGLDQPLTTQYVSWLKKAVAGDFGRSIRSQEPVMEMLAAKLPVTLELTFLAIVLSLIIGIPAGMVAAKWSNTWIDLVVSSFSLFGMAIPFFWFGVLLVVLFSVNLGWLPPSGYVPFTKAPLENLRLMILPTLTVGISMAALVMRQTRTSMLQILSQDYIRTARAKGQVEWIVVSRHVLRNALSSIITVVGLQTGALLGGAVITETVFSLPGLGRMVVEGIFQRDFLTVQGAVLVIVLAVLLVNIVTDLAYVVVDPRIKL